MFEKKTRLRVKNLLEQQFNNFRELEQVLGNNQIDRRSANERNMTRKTRLRPPRVQTAFQSGYCAVCHIPYNSLEDHLHSKRHLKLLGDDESYISLKGLDSLLALDEIDSNELNSKTAYSPPLRRAAMPRTRAASVMCDRIKHSPLTPLGCESGHHLRSRKNINYMTPPLDEDSLTEKPEVVKEFRELRSSSRILAKLAEQIVESDEVWNSGRPKRACYRHRPSVDERFMAGGKFNFRIETVPPRIRASVQREIKRPETPEDEKFLSKVKKPRNSELIRLNNEAENFLFPRKDETSDEDDEDGEKKTDTSSISGDDVKKFKIDDEDSMHSNSSESRGRKKRRTHAEAFILDNQKYYKFETPGSRLRYQGSYLSPVPIKTKNNGDYLMKSESDHMESTDQILNKYTFSFERVPLTEEWYKTFQRTDRGEEKYVFMNNEDYWNPFILPYQLKHVPPLDPRVCISQYNQIKKCLMEPPSASTSVTCSSPDPNASNSSIETVFHQDEDSKISASSASTLDDLRSTKRSRRPGTVTTVTGNCKNPRKSPRQHASTLAILSSLIHQRKRKSRFPVDFRNRTSLPTILEESPTRKPKPSKKSKVDYKAILRQMEEEFARVCEENLMDVEFDKNEDIQFKTNRGLSDIFHDIEGVIEESQVVVSRRPGAKPGRKPGRRKKNRTGWPINKSKRSKRDNVVKEEDESTLDSISGTVVDSDDNQISEQVTTNNSIKKTRVEKQNGENNNCNDQSSITDVNIVGNCDVNSDDRVGKHTNKVLKNKVNNSDLKYQPYVRVQKLDKHNLNNVSGPAKRSISPKRTSRGQRRMPASPKSPRMLRKPRGRWYRER